MTKFKNTADHKKELMKKSKESLVDLYLQSKWELAMTEAEIEYLKKALELACERVKYFEEMQDREMGNFEFFEYDYEYDLQAIIKYYIDKAKEMLENE